MQYYTTLIDSECEICTSDYVLDETLTRLKYDFGHHIAESFSTRLELTGPYPSVTILRVDELVWQESLKLFLKYKDQGFAFTDCTSFALCKRENVEEVFAFDHHFTIAGFILKPVM